MKIQRTMQPQGIFIIIVIIMSLGVRGISFAVQTQRQEIHGRTQCQRRGPDRRPILTRL